MTKKTSKKIIERYLNDDIDVKFDGMIFHPYLFLKEDGYNLDNYSKNVKVVILPLIFRNYWIEIIRDEKLKMLL